MTHENSPLARHIRTQARRLRKQNPELGPNPALDLAAINAGYQGWRHFLNAPQLSFSTTIRSVWQSDDREYREEHLTIPLHRSLKAIFPRADLLQMVGGSKVWICEKTGDLVIPRSSYSHHGKSDKSKQHDVREHVSYLARTLMFLDATGLKRSRAWKSATVGFPQEYRELGNPPCFDHTKIWRDEQGRYLITSEPYPERLERELGKLKKLADSSGYDVAVAKWPGMHNPFNHNDSGTRLLLISHRKRGAPLADIVPRIVDCPGSSRHSGPMI